MPHTVTLGCHNGPPRRVPSTGIPSNPKRVGRTSTSAHLPVPVVRETFTRTAGIPTTPRDFHHPVERTSYNDDVFTERYAKPVLTYAGFQRRGIRENSQSLAAMPELVERALLEPFPLSIETPLPAHTIRAAVFIRDSPTGAVASLWSKTATAPFRPSRELTTPPDTTEQVHPSRPRPCGRQPQHGRPFPSHGPMRRRRPTLGGPFRFWFPCRGRPSPEALL